MNSKPTTDKHVKNPTLVKNMPFVKHDQIPPKSGPNPQGLILNKKNSRKV